MIETISPTGRRQSAEDRLDEYRRFGGCVGQVPVPDFARALTEGAGGRIVVRHGWAVTSDGCLPVAGAGIADADDIEARAVLVSDDRFALAHRYSLHVLRVVGQFSGPVESSASSASAIGTALVSAQLAWCVQVLALLQDYFSARTAGTATLSKIPTLRHQLGEAQRQVSFFDAWLGAAGDAPSTLATDLSAFSNSLARLGGGRSFLAGNLCDSAAMFSLLITLYPGVDHA